MTCNYIVGNYKWDYVSHYVYKRKWRFFWERITALPMNKESGVRKVNFFAGIPEGE